MRKNLKFIIPIMLLLTIIVALVVFIVFHNNSNDSQNKNNEKVKTSKSNEDYSLTEKIVFKDTSYYVDSKWKVSSSDDVNYYYFDSSMDELLMVQSQDLGITMSITEDALKELVSGLIGTKGECFSSKIKKVEDKDWALIDAMSSDNMYIYCYFTVHNSTLYTFGIGKTKDKISDEHKELLTEFVKNITFNEEKTSINNTTTNKKKNTYTLGDTFSFDGLEITLGNTYNFTSVTNQYSDLYGKTIIQLPVTITNKTNDTHGLNMFYYTFYGANGTKIDNASTYFDEETTVEWSGDLRSGATATRNFYFEYDADGTYAIEYDNYSTKITVEFNVNK